ncbi:hypothetical protein ACHGLA_33050 [Streptomyces sp. YH02]|uniref:hypothetical protein n=1 Tax=Streptomyces sp. YH02 TaxID=3256999 RepID=UPI003757DA5D
MGAHDAFLPTSPVRRAAGLLLGTDLIVIGDAGHLVLDEAKDRIAWSCRRWWARVNGIKSA